MKSLKQVMEEMGFNKKAPIESQKAFFNHLIGKANIQKQTSKKSQVKTKAQPDNSQLEFVFKEDKQVS